MTHIIKSNISSIKKEHQLTKKDIDTFSNNLAISFKDYPLFEYFANYEYDICKMKKFWKVSLKTMSEKTFFVVDSESANSLAIFSPYEKAGTSIFKYIKAGGLSLLPVIGINSANRMTKFEKFAVKIKNKYSTPNCLYLYVFITMPEFRGQGLGSKIIRPILEYLDNEQQYCYLETLSPLNVNIYKKYGFDLKEVVNVPNTDLTLYAMLRAPKKTKKGNDYE